MPAELIIGAAIGAAVTSTHVRNAVRRGLIYGVGGVLIAYDKLAAGGRAVVQNPHEPSAAVKDSGATQANGPPATPSDASPPAPPVAASPAAGTPS